MRVLHTYCMNYNLGDYALGIGLKNLLRKYLDISLIGETNLQGRDFNRYYIKEVVNNKYDLLVIGGGGIIHGAHWPQGWFWLIEQELIRELEIPFIVYGVGYNYWPGEKRIPRRGIRHLQETFRVAKYFSVRNDGSASRIKSDVDLDLPEVPDPGFHVNLCDVPPLDCNAAFVIIQLAGDKPEYRYGNDEHRDYFVLQMRAVVRSLSREYLVIFAPHVLEDVPLSEAIKDGIENTEIWDFGCFAFDQTQEIFPYYKYAEFVISMRGHGQIVPIAFNTPVISLVNHPKHQGLMKNLGLEDYCISTDHESLSEEILDRVRLLKRHREDLDKMLCRVNERMSMQSCQAFVELGKLIRE